MNKIYIRLSDPNDVTVEEHQEIEKSEAAQIAIRFIHAQLEDDGLAGSIEWGISNVHES